MTCMISETLRFARTQFMLDLADASGKVTPDQFLAAVGGSQKLVSNILWIVKRSGYVDLKQVREGKKIAYWQLTVTGKCPEVKGELNPTEKKAAVASAAKPAKAAKAAKPAAKTKKSKSAEEIKAANLAKMKKVSAKLAAKKTKKTKTIDIVERELGSTGEIATSFNIDPAWDSVEGLDLQKLVA